MKPVPRSPWITLHRYLGLVAIPLLAFAAITGMMLCFLEPIDVALNADLFDQPTVAHPLPVTMAVERFAAAHPEWTILSFPLTVAPDRRIAVKVAPVPGKAPAGIDQLFLDRGTGALAGMRSDAAAWSRRGGAEFLHDVHYTLLGGKWGRWLMGVVALAWLIGHGIGFYLTFPLKAPFWKQWKRSWRFSFNSLLPRLLLDLHKVSGLWLFVPLLVIAFTSVAFNFFSEAWSPLADALFAEAPEIASTAPVQPKPLSFTGAVAEARALATKRGETWVPANVLYQPSEDRIAVMLTDDGTFNYRGLGPIGYFFDRKTHAFVRLTDPYHGDPNLTMNRILYPLHSGRTGGVLTVVLVFLTGLAVVLQCGTGLYVWWKKRKSRVAARRAMVARAAGR